jgi:Tfp pilus assembly major pilin PilA
MTPEEQRRADYEAAIGPNTAYYLPRFDAMDAGGSKAGWHWPAFFVTSYWFIYRMMWLPGLLCFFLPVIALAVAAIVGGLLGSTAGTLLFLLLWAAPAILFPVFATAIYRRHVHRLISRLRPDIAASPEQRQARLRRDGGTSAAAAAGVAVGALLFYGGVVAAISIPAYQDYTIRAQVTEGLNLASSVKADVAEYRAQHGQWPDQADLGGEMPSGKFVESVGVAAGSVVISYGNQANRNIAGQRLMLSPGSTADGEVVWACGNAPLPPDVEQAGGPTGSDLPNKYLPARCRGE